MNKHSRRFYFFASAGIGYLLFLSGCHAENSVPEGVYASPSLCDLGLVTVTGVQTVTGQFQIVNTTRKTVHIHRVKLSCGCAKINLSSEEIPAGGTIDAVLEVNLQGQYGKYVFEALVHTDDIANPHIPLQLAVDAAQKKLDGLIIFDLGNMGPGDQIDQTFSTLPGKISSVTAENVHHQSAVTAETKIKVSAEALINEKVMLTVSGTAPERSGEFSVEAKLKAEGADWEEATVQFNGRVRPDIAIPPSIPMGFIESGKTAAQRVNFISPADFFTNVKIDQMEVKNTLPENLSIKLNRSTTPYLEISLSYANAADTFSQNVELEFSLSNGKKCTLSTVVVARFL